MSVTPSDMEDGLVESLRATVRDEKDAKRVAKLPLQKATEFEGLAHPSELARGVVEAAEAFRAACERAAGTLDVPNADLDAFLPPHLRRVSIALPTPKPAEAPVASGASGAPKPAAASVAVPRAPVPSTRGDLVLREEVFARMPEKMKAMGARPSVTRNVLEHVLHALPGEAGGEAPSVRMEVLGERVGRAAKPEELVLAVCALEFLSKVVVTRPRTNAPWMVKLVERNVTDEDVAVLSGVARGA